MRFLATGVSFTWEIYRLRAWDIGIADSFIITQDIWYHCHAMSGFSTRSCTCVIAFITFVIRKTTAVFSVDSDAVISGRIWHQNPLKTYFNLYELYAVSHEKWTTMVNFFKSWPIFKILSPQDGGGGKFSTKRTIFPVVRRLHANCFIVALFQTLCCYKLERCAVWHSSLRLCQCF